MNQPNITVVIEGRTYTLRADDAAGMGDIPGEDRDRLINLLEMLKARREQSRRQVQAALARSSGSADVAPRPATVASAAPPKERVGKGDVDAIMARLIIEERQNKKPGIRPSTIYKTAALIVIIIAALSYF